LTLAEADAELHRLAVLKKNHLDEQFLARRNVRNLPGTIANLSERLANLMSDHTTATTHEDDPIVIGDRSCLRADVLAVLGNQLESLPRSNRDTCRVPLGVYSGLRFGLVLRPLFPPDVYLEGAATRQSLLSREHQGPRAVLNAVERLARGYDSECERVRQDLAIAEAQMRDYQARLGKPFSHDAFLSELTALRDKLKSCLSGMNPEPGTETQSTAAELAEQIKAVKIANTIETVTERSNKRSISAEEPVTARIRRRLDSALASDPSA
jgi:hypothetical protein